MKKDNILDEDMKGENRERIYGRHPTHETLLAGRRRVERITIAEGTEQSGIMAEILLKAAAAKIPVDFRSRDFLDELTSHHQGIIAEVSPYPYVTLQDLLVKVDVHPEDAFILLLDVIQDPQNLGSLLRTAEAVGVHGVIIPFRRGASITPAVVRSSAGACEHLWIAQGNLAQAIQELKQRGIWMVGLDNNPAAQLWGQINLSGPLGLVVGGEGEGLRRLVRESCDYLMRLPMRGKITSLNAAVAGSIALYAIWQAREFVYGS